MIKPKKRKLIMVQATTAKKAILASVLLASYLMSQLDVYYENEPVAAQPPSCSARIRRGVLRQS
jgi:hypothetical protein